MVLCGEAPCCCARRSCGYSDAVLLAACCTEHGLPIGMPACLLCIWPMYLKLCVPLLYVAAGVAAGRLL